MSQSLSPEPIKRSATLAGSFDNCLAREWLITNRRGAFASGTVLGCPTRRYHGLLIAPQNPPLQRFLLLAQMLEKVIVDDTTVNFSTFEFPGAIHPEGYLFQKEFSYNITADDQWVRFVYAHPLVEFVKEYTLSSDCNVVRMRYAATSRNEAPVTIELSPLLAMRDFHLLRQQPAESPWLTTATGGGVWVQDQLSPELSLFIYPLKGEHLSEVSFNYTPNWWHDFRYRVELRRGLDGGEDLCCLGPFRASGSSRIQVELVAVGFPESPSDAKKTVSKASTSTRENFERITGSTDTVRAKLLAAADQFIVKRKRANKPDSTTILAGYPWFGDWGRDAFISLEGLLLCSERFTEAREVLETFAAQQKNGLMPNLFSDYGDKCAYNSVDASLWFIHAACAYVRANGDTQAMNSLRPACMNVIDAFVACTDYSIGVNDKGLVRCGDDSTQITWMDARVDNVPVTPRHGCPVEVNALWYSNLKQLLELEDGSDQSREAHLQKLLSNVEKNFERVFWNEKDQCLYDFVLDGMPDATVRPNQIFAVSLPFSPLPRDKQIAVVKKVRHDLLTPLGLRTLSPVDSRYRGHHEGDYRRRDYAYHNGTVWAWLMGPFVEANLRVNDFSNEAKREGRALLVPLIEHLSEGCIGQISEIFNGDPPHHPRGCFAQAWSVAELLRMYDATA